MVIHRARRNIPVLVLYNLDPAWTEYDRCSVINEVANMESSLAASGHIVSSVAIESDDLSKVLSDVDPMLVLVFNWCEDLPGIKRGDVKAAKDLEQLGFYFTGPSSNVIDLCWEKVRVKRLLDSYCIPTPVWKMCCSPRSAINWKRFPAIVKPAREHCSVGVDRQAIVDSTKGLEERITFVLDTYHQPAIVEEFICGRELHVTILGDKKLSLLPPVEMDFSLISDIYQHLCCWDSKFTPGSEPFEKIGLKIPAELNRFEMEALRSVCFATYRAVGCRDVARLDLREDGGVFFVLDVNPNPDLSSEASSALAANSIGISYGEMISHIVNLAALRHPRFGGARPRRRVHRAYQLSLFG